MNANRFRWVFSQRWGMRVPAPETVRGRRAGACGLGIASMSTPRLAAGWSPLTAALGLLWAGLAQAQMPVPCAGGPCGANPAALPFVAHGAANYVVNGGQGVVTQTTPRAILNWASYNLGAGNSLTYRFQDATGNLPAGASFSTLNRIWQGSPSEIAGRIQVQPGQSGQIYLINQNGIVFKDGAQVNVGSLVASTLDISDNLYLNGLVSNLNADTVPAFLGSSGGVVRVEGGAELRSELGGRVMLLAENVENHGLIQTPEGQTILAAGNKVYLAVSDDPRLRGFLVEVDGGGTAANTGRIIAERGNVSLTGLTVNQSGRVTATTSVNMNGSIRLMARDTVSSYKDPAQADARAVPMGTRTGALQFGASSVTEVLPETASSATALDEQAFNRSRIEVIGRGVHVQANATLRAPAGEITLSAQEAQFFRADTRAADVRLQVDSGAVLDVAGLRDVAIPVERNYIQVELRGDELKDAPLQRDSFLRGSTVWIDIEQGTPLANVAGHIARVGRSVAEKSTAGGDIALSAEGDLVLNPGARLDVSGGNIAYQSGWGRTTQLTLNGRTVDIGNARPDVRYDGFADRYEVTDPKWGATRSWDIGRRYFVPGYLAGRDAGRLSLTAHTLVVQAELRGERLAGERQRAKPPRSGALQISGLSLSGAEAADLQNFRFAATAAARSVAFDAPIPTELARELVLSAEAIRTGGLGRLGLTSEGRIDLPEGVVLDAGVGGSVTLTGRGLTVEGRVLAPGGEITLTTRTGQSALSLEPGVYDLRIGPRAQLNVAGQWVNDLATAGTPAAQAAFALDAGTIRLSAHADLDLAPGSLLDASAGARLSADGRLNYGRPGSITLATGRFGQLSEADPLTARLRLAGVLAAYGFDRGGRLSITTSRVQLGGASGTSGELVLGEGFFAAGGFQSFELTGVDGVRLAEGFRLVPRPLALQLVGDYRLRTRRDDMAEHVRFVELPVHLQPATQVTLRATDRSRGDLYVADGAHIGVAATGSITLEAHRQLEVFGNLVAPAGRITLRQTEIGSGELDFSSNADAARSVFLGSQSRLLATGTYIATPDARGLRQGRVLDGGEVVVEAGKGVLIHQAGARIDVSGARAVLDLPTSTGLRATEVASAGGGIRLSAREGMLLEGDLIARAGGTNALGGRLSLELARVQNWTGAVPASWLQQRRIVLQDRPTELTVALRPGQPLDMAALNGLARLSTAQIMAGGFADLDLQAQHRLAFAAELNLDLAGRLALHAPNVEALGDARVRVDAAAIRLGPDAAGLQAETLRNDARGGDGRLTLSADLIELVGHSSLQGFDTVELRSRGDLRVQGVAYNASTSTRLEDTDNVFRGGLASGGDLYLTARQIYPVSMAEFAIEVHNRPNGRIVISATGPAGAVLSAGGRLRLSAPSIEQGGVLKAPFGEISLQAEYIERRSNRLGVDGLPSGLEPVSISRESAADGEIRLLPGSLTSVSGEGWLLPLGRTELSGRDWVYDFGPYKRVFDTPPERRIVLDADRVHMAAGARIDLSGDGDLYAYEFQPGPGGSRDILSGQEAMGLYALLPAAGLNHAPFDTQTLLGTSGWWGDAAVRLLEDAGELRAGTYALLPARYALLPGAYLVRVAGIDSDRVPRGAAALPTGYLRVAGHIGRVSAGGALVHGVRTATLEVAPGNLARAYSEYLDSRASTHFARKPVVQRVDDAGRLAIAVRHDLDLGGSLMATWGQGARGPEVDIAAARLAITSGGTPYGGGAAYVSLSDEQLTRLGAASLLLGGVRDRDDTNDSRVRLEQRSETLVVAAEARLMATELILVARDRLAVEPGAELSASGSSAARGRDVLVTSSDGDGAGALIRLATSGQGGDVTRAPVVARRGLLEVDAGVALHAQGSIHLDATLDTRVQGSLGLPASGGSLSIGAGHIRLTEAGATGIPADGLVLDQTRLAGLGNPAQLRLRSYGSVDLHGQVELGGPWLESLMIEAAGLAGHAGVGGRAHLRAREVTLANPEGIDPEAALLGALGTGDLVVEALHLSLGPGEFAVRGFGQVQLTATQELQGRGGSLQVGGDLRVEAGRLTVAAGVDQVIRSDGALSVAGLPAVAPSASAPLGGRLELAGKILDMDARIELPAGDVILRGRDGLTLGARSVVLAGGVSVPFADVLAHAPGGRVIMQSSAGDVRLAAGSHIDVSGAVLGGQAGELIIDTRGDAIIEGSLAGAARAGQDSGRFSLAARRLNPDALGSNDYAGLNTLLETGGFHQSRRIRVREGDLVVPDLHMRAAEIVLAADSGQVRIGGLLDASGAKGGRIEIFAGGDLALLAGARLLAHATEKVDTPWGTAGRGGSVLLSSGATGRLQLAEGSLIDVSVPAGSAADAGRVILRAARGGTGVALGEMKGRILGAQSVELEAYRIYTGVTALIAGTTSGTRLGLSTLHADNTAFVNTADPVAVKGDLDTGRAVFLLRPGVEVQAPGNLALSQDWQLNPLRYRDGSGGVLTLRAAGDMRLDANLSDGFSTATAAGLLQSADKGWDYRLVAGADLTAADPRMTSSAGNVLIAANRLVRTGPGRMEVAAGGDVVLGTSAAVYTAGYTSPVVDGFSLTGLNGWAFPTGGGDVLLRAGGAIIATNGPSGLVTDWLWRQGNIAAPNSTQFRTPGWWPQIGEFRNGVAALGGGDLRIETGGRVANLLAATVSNARQPAVFGQAVDAARQVILGGGDLTLRAGGPIEGGIVHADRGFARLSTRAGVVAGQARGDQHIGTVLALGDARVEVTSRQAITLAAIVNPSLVPQTSGNLSGTGGTQRESYFVSYGDHGAVRLTAVSGELVLSNDVDRLQQVYRLAEGKVSGLSLNPPELAAAALTRDLTVKGKLSMPPSPNSELMLLAAGHLRKTGQEPLYLSDVALQALPSLAAPQRSIAAVNTLVDQPERESDRHGPERIHTTTPRPAYFVANTGDVAGQPSPAVFAVLAKPAVVEAGRDIVDVTLIGQNLQTGQVTRLQAGRDIRFGIVREPVFGRLNPISSARIAIGGPGKLELIAGRHVDLGASLGVITRGNLVNPFLPEGGAEILVIAGALAADPSGELRPLDGRLREGAVLDAFFAELAASAADGAASRDYSRGEAAIAGLFPEASAAGPLTRQGDVNLFFSQIKTEQGGTIRILAPGGMVNAGLASVSEFQRPAADLGVMTVQGGSIEAYTRGDFQVNSSRVFTISGGDILLWSAEGNIDAGKGAKTASATPPPRLRIDAKGNFVLDVSQSIAGSGIGALKAGSNVYLVAPKGEVNAGDAGIRAGGNLTIAAERVVGADNIQVGGVSTGVPVAETGSLGASLSGVSNLGDATKATQEATQSVSSAARKDEQTTEQARQALASFRPSFISVEVLGFGDTGSSQDEAETRRRRMEQERARSGGA